MGEDVSGLSGHTDESVTTDSLGVWELAQA